MIGRQTEREVIGQKLSDFAASGAGHVVILEGEAGIGKSRLLQSLSHEIAERGISVLLVAGDAVERRSPLHAWSALFTRLLAIDRTGAQPDSRRARVRTWLDEAPHLAPLLNPVLPFELPDNDVTRSMDGQTRWLKMRELIAHLLPRLVARAHGNGPAPHPFVIVVEDGQWLDSASWALLREVRSRLPSLLYLIATRPMPDPVPETYVELRTLSDTTHLHMGNLSESETTELLEDRLGVASVPRALVDLVHDRAEGHPLFTEEILMALQDRGHLEIAGSECRLHVANVPLPGSLPSRIEEVIASRLDGLTPSQQLTLAVASVAGRTFAQRLIDAVHPTVEAQANLQENLTQLIRLELIVADLGPGERTYTFEHGVTQEIAYARIGAAQRRDLHRAVARWYEITHRKDLSRLLPLLAHHWSSAGQPDRAVAYLDQAADQALRPWRRWRPVCPKGSRRLWC